MIRSITRLCLFVALLQVALCSGDDHHYVVYHGREATQSENFKKFDGSIPELKSLCSSTEECVGFTSDGWLKSSVSKHLLRKASSDLYVKEVGAPIVVSPTIVPMPQKMTNGTSVVGVPSNLKINGATDNADLTLAIQRYTALIFLHPGSSTSGYSTVLPSLTITVANTSAPLQYGVDESYQLTIPNDGSAATITANTNYGAYRALETLSQLILFNFDTQSYEVTIAPVNIADFPRFSHRGILLDTARHYEPVTTIAHFIDSLTYAKFNVFHWHMTDDQSFPLESTSSPDLWRGSYSAQERYTQADVAWVVEYARQRGVRVVVEFDMPGHASSWCTGYPDICPSTTCLSPLNPATNLTFDVVNALLDEMTGGQPGKGLFFDDFIHLGGDEVNTDCWTSTPAVQAWLTQKNFTANQAYMYYVERVHSMALAQGRNPVNWEEVFNNFGTLLDKRSVIHVWLDHATLGRVVAAGYRGILSNNDVWYLDHLGTTWQQFYLNEPFENITVPEQQALVLGGEVCMWGETVDTSDVFETVWPRAAAAAERLWSNIDQTDVNEFEPRLINFRCLLNRRGIGAAPVLNPQARTSPPGPGSCYVQ